jgi:hypothetical protein
MKVGLHNWHGNRIQGLYISGKEKEYHSCMKVGYASGRDTMLELGPSIHQKQNFEDNLFNTFEKKLSKSDVVG